MNTKELIKHYEDMSEKLNVFPIVAISRVLKDLRQLDEPKKPVVQQFVADWYEKHKDDFETKLFRAVDLIPSDYEEGELSEFEEWLVDEHTAPFQTLVNMHQFGYEVEKEKRYTVKIKGVHFNSGLIFDETNKKWFFSSIYEVDHQRGHHTRKELEEAGFGWVFDCPGMEVEEVEG
jgi:gp178